MKPLFALILSVSAAVADPVQDFWFNGAEISSFKLDQSRYGKNHPGHAELIFVTEPFLTDKQVKNERGKPNSTTVLKLNALTTFNTGIYSYRTMTSTFRPIDLEKFPHCLKSTSSIQDWCGQAFQQFNYRKNTWTLELRSYFEDEGDANQTLGNGFLEDELWLTLRLDPKRLPTGDVAIVPGAIFTRFMHKPVQLAKANASILSADGISTYSLNYPALERSLTIQFDSAFPHIIRKWSEKTSSGTTTANLEKRLMNVAYWNLHDPQDAAKRKELGLDPLAN